MQCALLMSMQRDLEERVFRLALGILRWAGVNGGSGVSRDALRQLVRATTSIGANLEEARGAETKPDFIHKVAVARKEAFEALYWARLLEADRADAALREFRRELNEVAAILTVILKRSRESSRRGEGNRGKA